MQKKRSQTSASQAIKKIGPLLRGLGGRYRYLLGAIILVVIVLAGLLTWPSVPDDETARLAKQVGTIAVLPADAKPQVMTVADPTEFEQPFLAQSQKGDKVLIYPDHGLAVVYRPSSHQVVNMGPVVTGTNQVFLRNGTNDEQAVPPLAAKIESRAADFTVISQDQSPRADYTETLVINLAGNEDQAQRLATVVGGRLAELPAGESVVDADYLIIIGADQLD